MNKIDQIKQLLEEAESVPLKEGEIVIYSGYEATIEARAIRRCLRILEKEEEDVSQS